MTGSVAPEGPDVLGTMAVQPAQTYTALVAAGSGGSSGLAILSLASLNGNPPAGEQATLQQLFLGGTVRGLAETDIVTVSGGYWVRNHGSTMCLAGSNGGGDRAPATWQPCAASGPTVFPTVGAELVDQGGECLACQGGNCVWRTTCTGQAYTPFLGTGYHTYIYGSGIAINPTAWTPSYNLFEGSSHSTWLFFLDPLTGQATIQNSFGGTYSYASPSPYSVQRQDRSGNILGIASNSYACGEWQVVEANDGAVQLQGCAPGAGWSYGGGQVVFVGSGPMDLTKIWYLP